MKTNSDYHLCQSKDDWALERRKSNIILSSIHYFSVANYFDSVFKLFSSFRRAVLLSYSLRRTIVITWSIIRGEV